MIGWLIVGALAGWLAGEFTRGGGFGFWKNMGLGLVGSVVGGVLCQILGVRGHGLAMELFVATGGAVLLVLGLDWLRERRDGGRPSDPYGGDPTTYGY